MEYLKPPEEYAMPPEEYNKPPEEHHALPDNEYYGQKPVGKADEDDRKRRRLLRMILIPVAATVGAVSLLFASIGYDPLGTDFLEAKAPEPTAEPELTPEPTEAPFPTTEPGMTPVPTPVPIGEWDDAFPELGNLFPDFAGEWAWSGMGSEEYLTVTMPGDSDPTYLVMGSVWGEMTDSEGNPNVVKTVEGASYDKETNTLTLTDFTCDHLEVNLMGNGFTIRLEGENRINTICVWGAMYGGSLTIVGPGKLTVLGGSSAPAILLNAEDSESCLMIGGDATVDIYGASTIEVCYTTLYKALYFLMPIDMTGGTMQLVEGSDNGEYRTFTVVDENGEVSTHVSFTPRWTTEEPDPE
ncbi:MAG: hypothetical protein J5854_00220 [Clostridia bacterium]|nr:hypothetical protein [Clostridia bacterium]